MQYIAIGGNGGGAESLRASADWGRIAVSGDISVFCVLLHQVTLSGVAPIMVELILVHLSRTLQLQKLLIIHVFI